MDRQPPSTVGTGLSPRVRGNLCKAPSTPHGKGSIPRVCGGTGDEELLLEHPMGLSPRVRGNPFLGIERPTVPGSIPACAGEPRSGG